MTKEQILAQYNAECEEIEAMCEAEGYPARGSNYDLRCENLWNDYYAAEYEDAAE